MNEELLIKVKVDTSSITTTMNKLKNEVSNINKSMNVSSSSSSSTAAAAAAASKSTNKLGESIGKLVTKVKEIKGMSALDFTALTASLLVAEKAAKGIGEGISDAFEKANVNMPNIDWRKWIGTEEGAKITEMLSKPFGNLRVKLSSLKGAIPKNLGELKTSLSAIGGKIGTAASGAMASLGGALKAVASAAGVAVSAIGIFAVVLGGIAGTIAALKVSKLGDDIYHTAQRFGMATEAFQEWSWIMERNGGTIDDLTGFMETLASEQAAVIEGSEDAAANFKRLGLSMEEVAGMRQQELFEETVKRIQQIEDATQRSAIAYSIFGDEASKFMNVLNMSNQEMTEAINNYHLLGGAMSGQLLEQSHSLQSSIANMKQAWQGISNTLAEVFIPVVRAVVNWLTKAFVIVNLFLRSIFGLDLRTTGVSDSMNGAAGSTNKYTGGVKAAIKATEQLKRVTMGFDELNIVTDPNKASGDSANGGGASMPSLGGMGDMSSLMPDMSGLNLEGIYAWFEEYKTLIQDITAWSLVIIGVIAAVAFGLSGNIIGCIGALAAVGVGIAIGSGEGGTWDKFITGVVNVCKTIVDTVVGWVKDITAKLKEFGEWIYTKFIQPVVDFFKELWAGIVEIFSPIVDWFSKLFDSVGKTIKSVLDVIVGLFRGTWELIKAVWGVVSDWFKSKIIDPVAGFFRGMWDSVKGAASKAWEGIKSVFSPVVEWFKNVFTKAWAGVKAVFSTGGKIFDGIKDGIANVFKTVVNGIIGGINKVIAVPFNAINKLLNKIRSVSVAGIEPFKGFIKYNALSVPQIPKLAKGGLITGSVLANIGEAGQELVLPLENNTGWMDTLADKIAARNSSPSKIVLQVGERELGWATIDSINNITKQTGGIQLAL